MKAKTRVTSVTNSKGSQQAAMKFQHQVAQMIQGSEVETYITDGANGYWADIVDGDTIIDVKHAGPVESPYRFEATSFFNQAVAQSTAKQFATVKALLATTEYSNFAIIVNDEAATDFFAKVAEQVGLEISITTVSI